MGEAGDLHPKLPILQWLDLYVHAEIETKSMPPDLSDQEVSGEWNDIGRRVIKQTRRARFGTPCLLESGEVRFRSGGSSAIDLPPRAKEHGTETADSSHEKVA